MHKYEEFRNSQWCWKESSINAEFYCKPQKWFPNHNWIKVKFSVYKHSKHFRQINVLYCPTSEQWLFFFTYTVHGSWLFCEQDYVLHQGKWRNWKLNCQLRKTLKGPAKRLTGLIFWVSQVIDLSLSALISWLWNQFLGFQTILIYMK